jgi:hypothetical protein
MELMELDKNITGRISELDENAPEGTCVILSSSVGELVE